MYLPFLWWCWWLSAFVPAQPSFFDARVMADEDEFPPDNVVQFPQGRLQ